jgi:hypothetical protein
LGGEDDGIGMLTCVDVTTGWASSTLRWTSACGASVVPGSTDRVGIDRNGAPSP